MGRKIFVSYKYMDSSVQSLFGVISPTWPSDYVEYIRKNVLSNDDIYKGENQDEDISYLSDDQIRAHLKDKIYDSTLTIVLLSPNMRESYKPQKEQWIPWEIEYSLRETTRHDRTSHNNAILAIILPDVNGSYYYYQNFDNFDIISENIKNDYIYVTQWNEFLRDPVAKIELAFIYRNIVPPYKIIKTI